MNNLKTLSAKHFKDINSGHGIKVITDGESIGVRIYIWGNCGKSNTEVDLWSAENGNSITADDLKSISDMFLEASNKAKEI